MDLPQTVSPLPRHGVVLAGRDQQGRLLRVSRHDQRLVLSVWQDDVCRATVRLSPADAATLIGALADLIADQDELAGDRGRGEQAAG